jgi:hypothetical protein
MLNVHARLLLPIADTSGTGPLCYILIVSSSVRSKFSSIPGDPLSPSRSVDSCVLTDFRQDVHNSRLLDLGHLRLLMDAFCPRERASSSTMPALLQKIKVHDNHNVPSHLGKRSVSYLVLPLNLVITHLTNRWGTYRR